MCSLGTLNIYWPNAPVLQQLCKLSQMPSYPIFGACILFFFWSGCSRLGTSWSVTNGCVGVSLSLLPARTQAVEAARAGDFLPSWLFSLSDPLPLTGGTQTVFQMLILNFPLERKMFPIGIPKVFSDLLMNQ